MCGVWASVWYVVYGPKCSVWYVVCWCVVLCVVCGTVCVVWYMLCDPICGLWACVWCVVLRVLCVMWVCVCCVVCGPVCRSRQVSLSLSALFPWGRVSLWNYSLWCFSAGLAANRLQTLSVLPSPQYWAKGVPCSEGAGIQTLPSQFCSQGS